MAREKTKRRRSRDNGAGIPPATKKRLAACQLEGRRMPTGGTASDPLNLKHDGSDEPAAVHQRRYSVKTLTKDLEQKSTETQSTGTVKVRQANLKERYRYGNFNYFHRVPAPFQNDPRTIFMVEDWFVGKDVLDIGCNAGWLTISIARLFAPRKILGVDIDKHLVKIAQKNIRHFYDMDVKVVKKFPASFPLAFGPICIPPTATTADYPNNVWFKEENYVLETDEDLENVKEEFDVILAFGVSKWIHLNWGDAGLKRSFKRAFRQLRTGGLFILEPQSQSSYKKHSKVNDEIANNYNNITFWQDQFVQYLLSEEVGFADCDFLDTPLVSAYGCDAPLLMFYKGPIACNGGEIESVSPPSQFPDPRKDIATPDHHNLPDIEGTPE